MITGALVLAVSLIAGFVIAPPDENRARVAPPSARDLVALEGDALGQLIEAAEDRLGVRSVGVGFDRWLREDLAEEHVFDQHVRGHDGWLFYRWPVELACDPAARPVDQIITETRRMQQVAEAAGLELLVLVPPDKGAVMTRHLAPFEEEAACMARDIATLTAARSPDAPLLTAYDALRPVGEGDELILGEVAYFREDSHWRSAAALELAFEVHEAVDPAHASALERVDLGPWDRAQDLARISGRTVTDTERLWGLRTPGTEVRRVDAEAPDTPRTIVEGGVAPRREAVMVRDSFGEFMIEQLAPVASEAHFCRCLCSCIAMALRPMLEEADLFIYETVQRTAHKRIVDLRVAGQLAMVLGDRLVSEPVSAAPDGTYVAPTAGLLRIWTEGEVAQVRVSGSGGTPLVIEAVDGYLPAAFADQLPPGPLRIEVVGGTVASVEHAPL